jgi:hypothetical protein
VSRPWSLNLVMMVGRVLLGAGMSLLEPCTLAPRESLRPSGTIHPGPPVCSDNSFNKANYHMANIAACIIFLLPASVSRANG